MKKIIAEYKKKKYEIKKRLKEFKVRKGKDVFAELCFCILTPQSKATSCDEAVKALKKSGLLFKGNLHDIKEKLKGKARFHNKKAAYLIGARNVFQKEKKFKFSNAFETREWLVKNIKGLGYKEASHFLRNIGRGENLAILDVHILKNLKKFGVIKKIPTTITKKSYIDIEKRMGEFSRRTRIPLEELDLLFWSRETGFVFK